MHCRRARLAAHFARSAPGVRRHGSRLNSSGVCSGSAVNKRRRFNGHRESAAHLQCRPTRLEARATEQCARDMPATRLASACDCERLLASSSYVGHVDGCRAKPPESPASAHLAVLALPPAGRAPRCRPGPPDASRRGGGGGCSEGSAGLGRARGKWMPTRLSRNGQAIVWLQKVAASEIFLPCRHFGHGVSSGPKP